MKTLRFFFISLLFIFCSAKNATSQTIDELDDKVEDFVEESREIYRMDTEALEYIWEAYCGLLDPKIENTLKFATEVGLNYQQKEDGKVNDLLNRSISLIESLNKMMENDETEDKAEDLLEDLNKEVAILNKLKNGVVLKGSNHPFVQLAIEHGKNMHKYMCDDHDADYKICDSNFPGVDGRPDLVFVDDSGLWILEFKPNNRDAISKGEDQVEGYLSDIVDYFEDCFPNGRTGDFTSYGGPANDSFLKAVKDCDAAWSSDGKDIIVHTSVATYEPCEKRFER